MAKKGGELKGTRKAVKSSVQRRIRKALVDTFALTETQLSTVWPTSAALEEQRMSNFSTIYLCNSQPVIFTHEPKGGPVEYLPTMYLAHAAPQMIPALRIAEGVKRKICSRGDRLFMPGVLVSESRDVRKSWVEHNFGRFARGDKVFLRENGEWMPFAVAEWLLDWRELEHKGRQGESIGILHHIDDEVWLMGDGKFPLAFPDDSVAIALAEIAQKKKEEDRATYLRQREENLQHQITVATEFLDHAPKTLRKLQKQLRQITQLKEKIGQNLDQLDKDQQAKLDREASVLAEIDDIECQVKTYTLFLEDPQLPPDPEADALFSDDQPPTNADAAQVAHDSVSGTTWDVPVSSERNAVGGRDSETGTAEQHASQPEEGKDGASLSVDAVAEKMEEAQLLGIDDRDSSRLHGNGVMEGSSNAHSSAQAEHRSDGEEQMQQQAQQHDEQGQQEQEQGHEEVHHEEMLAADEIAKLSLILAIKTTLGADQLPILASNAVAQHLRPAATRMGKGAFNLKATPWKKVKPFLVAMAEKGLLVLDDSGPALSITSIDYTHSMLLDYDVEDLVGEDSDSDDGEGAVQVSSGKMKADKVPKKPGRKQKKPKIQLIEKRVRNHNQVFATDYIYLGVKVTNEARTKLKKMVNAPVKEADTPTHGQHLVFHCKDADAVQVALMKVFGLTEKDFSRNMKAGKKKGKGGK